MEKRMNWQGFLVLAAILVTVFIIGMMLISSQLNQNREKSTALQFALNHAYAGNNELVAELELVGTTGFIESSARRDLNYIKPGELCFEFANPEALYAYTAEELDILMEEMTD